ncbi:MAG: MmcQ/YjbR family DNA-binding protein [Gemmataceae bacterium]|nr:MmcQ/YjbR family DNA-binding protein [Gemmataceae bacterium]MCI0740563.1 MmcQ/YjbR family DNA-binding protein [Gemmataceae bacterium]
MQALRKIALAYPEAEEGIACKGTALECATFKARNKTFLFLGAADLRVKLSESLSEAVKLQAKEPNRYKVGAHGWVAVVFGSDKSTPIDVLERWIDESYRLLVPKQLVALLPQCGPLSGGKEHHGVRPRGEVQIAGSSKTAKKKTPKKKSGAR